MFYIAFVIVGDFIVKIADLTAHRLVPVNLDLREARPHACSQFLVIESIMIIA